MPISHMSNFFYMLCGSPFLGIDYLMNQGDVGRHKVVQWNVFRRDQIPSRQVDSRLMLKAVSMRLAPHRGFFSGRHFHQIFDRSADRLSP